VGIAATHPRTNHAKLAMASSARILNGVVLACLVGVLGSMAVGFRALIVRSGSMAPTIEAGDLIVTRVVHPDAVEVDDVVTFRDPTRSGELVTHRVIEVEDQGDRRAFVTRGDANSGVEQWTVAGDGTVGVLTGRLPAVGRWLSWVSIPVVHVALLVGGASLIGIVLIRRVWAR
jgi:signal peptidase I